MAPHLSNLQYVLVLGALAFVSILTLAAIIDIRRKRKAPPFLNYFYSNLDQDPYEDGGLHQPSFNGLTELRAYNRANAYENRTNRNSPWE